MFEPEGHYRSAQMVIGPRVIKDPSGKTMKGPIGLGSEPVMKAGRMAFGT
jgi:hypothetical protein